MSTDIQTKPASEITINDRGALSPRNFEGLYRLATIMAASGLMPKGMDRPETVFVAVQMGLEVGLSPMAAVQNIAVVNGRPTIWGDAMLGLIRGSGLMEAITEDLTGEGEAATAICTVWRKGEEHPSVGRFSVADAKRAQLWGKAGPWTQYPRRMLQMRARGFALRDKFPDILKGLYSREEMEGAQEHYMGEAAVVETGVVDTAIEALVGRRSASHHETVAVEPEPAKEPTEPASGLTWPRALEDGGWVDSAGQAYDPERHGWSTEGRPAVTADGTFRAKRGTRGNPAAKHAPEPEPLELASKDPEPPACAVHADREEPEGQAEAPTDALARTKARIQEATINGLQFRIEAASELSVLPKLEDAVMAAAISGEAREDLLRKLAVRAEELVEAAKQ